MTEARDLPEPITSSRVTIPPSERARALYAKVSHHEGEPTVWNVVDDVLDVLAHANRDAVRELLNARREGAL